MDHTVKSLHRLLSGSTTTCMMLAVPSIFGWNMKRSKLSAAIADSILPLWCSGRVGQRCSLFRRRDGATLRIGWSRALLPSLFAGSKGEGTLTIGALHKRLSHGPLGEMTVGAKTLRDHKRQEIFAYFHPGDMKSPLNIYFSGYRPAEGFEGFGMMRAMVVPLFSFLDPRLEGGSFIWDQKN